METLWNLKRNFIVLKVELEDDELKELLLGDREDQGHAINYGQDHDEIIKSEATEQIKAKAYERMNEQFTEWFIGFVNTPPAWGL